MTDTLNDMPRQLNTKLGVVITSFNHSEYIDRCIQSVLTQSVQFDAVVIVDDGSSPDCFEHVRRITEERGLQLIRQVNAGVANARNHGLRLLDVDYVVFLDDDDYISSIFVEVTHKLLREYSFDGICYRSVPVGKQLVNVNPPAEHLIPSRVFSSELLTYCPATSPGACVFNRNVLIKLGGFDESIWGADDFDLLVRLGKSGEIAKFPLDLLCHRIHDRNASHQHLQMSINIGKVIVKNYRNATFDELILLSYWYASYGPAVFLCSVFRLAQMKCSGALLLRFVSAYIVGRTFRRLG